MKHPASTNNLPHHGPGITHSPRGAGHHSYHRGSKRAQRLCLDTMHLILSSASQIFLFLWRYSHPGYQKQGTNSACPAWLPRAFGAWNDYRFPTPCPPPRMKHAFCKLFPSLIPLSFCSSSEPTMVIFCAFLWMLTWFGALKVWPRDHLYQNPLGAVSRRGAGQ